MIRRPPRSTPSHPTAPFRPGEADPVAESVAAAASRTSPKMPERKDAVDPPQPAGAIVRGEADPVAESLAATASNRKSINPNRPQPRRSQPAKFPHATFFLTH